MPDNSPARVVGVIDASGHGLNTGEFPASFRENKSRRKKKFNVTVS